MRPGSADFRGSLMFAVAAQGRPDGPAGATGRATRSFSRSSSTETYAMAGRDQDAPVTLLGRETGAVRYAVSSTARVLWDEYATDPAAPPCRHDGGRAMAPGSEQTCK
jgi:hypothetical protein